MSLSPDPLDETHSLLDAAGAAVWVYDVVLKEYTFVSAAASKLLGKGAGSGAWAEALSKKEQHAREKAIAKAASGKKQTTLFCLPGKKKPRWIQEQITAKGDRLYGVLADVTNLKERELRYKNEARRASVLHSAIPDAMVRLTREGDYLEVKSPHDYDLVNEPDALTGRNIYDNLPPALADRCMEVVRDALETGAMQTFFYEIEVDSEMRCREARVVTSGKDEVIAIMRDVTDRMRAELTLERERDFVHTVVESIQEGVIALDEAGHITLRNSAAEKLFQFDEERAVPSIWADAFRMLDVEGDAFIAREQSPVTKALQGDAVENQEVRIRPEVGPDRHVLVSGREITDAGTGARGAVLALRDVTTRVRAEKDLKESKELLDSVLRSTPDGVIALRTVRDQQGNIQDFHFLIVNQHGAQIVGRKEHDLMGALLLEEFPSTKELGLFDEYVKVVETGETFSIQIHIRPGELEMEMDGPQWFHLSAAKMGDGLVLTYRDITQQKQAEEELRESERMLSRAAGIAHFGAFEWNATTNALWWSDELYKIYGIDPSETVSAERFRSFLHPDDRERVWSEVQRALSEKSAFSYAERIIREDGSERQLFTQGEVLEGEDGSLRLAGVCHDVTEEEKMRAALRLSDRRFRAIFDSAFQFMGLLDPDGTVLEANQTALEFGQQVAGDVIGKKFWETYWWEHDAEERDRLADAIARAAQGELVRYNMEAQDFQGNIALVDFSAKPIRNERGEIILLLVEGRDISEDVRIRQEVDKLKAAQEALRRSEEHYRFMAESLHLQVWTALPDGNLDFVNQQIVDYFGVAPEALIGEGWASVVHPEDLQRAGPRWAHAVASGERYEIEFRLRRRDGQYRWHISRADALRNADGEIVKWFGANTDIHDVKMAEDALRTSEEQLRSVINNLPELAWTARPDGYVEFFNARWYEYTGTTPEEMLGWGWEKVARPEDKPRVLAAWEEVLREEKTIEIEYGIRGADGIYRSFLTRAHPLRDSEGNVVRWIGTNSNVDDLRRASAALEEAQAELAEMNRQLEVRVEERTSELERLTFEIEQILESAGEGIYGVDNAGRTTFINSAASRMLGWTKEEMIGQPQHDMIHYAHDDGSSYPAEECPIYAAFNDGDVHTVSDEVFWRKDGTSFPVEYTSTPIRVGGKVNGAVVVFRDITRRKEFEAERQRYERELERSNQELQQFAYVASHDLQEPLRMVSGFLDLLVRRYGDALDEGAREYIGYAVDGALRMKTLINDLLSYSRVRTQGREFAPVDLNKLVHGVLRVLGTRIEETGAVVEVGELPTVEGDEVQLAQLFQNLIGNALKFRKPDTPPRVEITAEREGNRWRIRVTDNGIGIAKEYQDRVFQIFQRLHGRDKYEGTGIGLAICKRVVERHHGTLDLTSDVDVGSTFSLTLQPAP